MVRKFNKIAAVLVDHMIYFVFEKFGKGVRMNQKSKPAKNVLLLISGLRWATATVLYLNLKEVL